jgi:hypothetical protein
MLKLVCENANLVAISRSFFAFGFILGKETLELTAGQELTVLVAGATCGLEVLVMSYSNRKWTALRARLSL